MILSASMRMTTPVQRTGRRHNTALNCDWGEIWRGRKVGNQHIEGVNFNHSSAGFLMCPSCTHQECGQHHFLATVFHFKAQRALSSVIIKQQQGHEQQKSSFLAVPFLEAYEHFKEAFILIQNENQSVSFLFHDVLTHLKTHIKSRAASTQFAFHSSLIPHFCLSHCSVFIRLCVCLDCVWVCECVSTHCVSLLLHFTFCHLEFQNRILFPIRFLKLPLGFLDCSVWEQEYLEWNFSDNFLSLLHCGLWNTAT